MRTASKVEDVIAKIQSYHRVFIHGAAATPHHLINEMVRQADRLVDVEIIHIHTFGEALYASPQHRKSFLVTNLFVGENIRKKIDYDRVDYLPCFLSEIPTLFRNRIRPLNVALVHVSPPDLHGFCTLGTSVDVAKAAVESADIVLAQINHQMPRVRGDGFIHIDEIDDFIEIDEALPEVKQKKATEEESKIAGLIANLIEDGSTLQMGIGTIPDGTLAALKNHRHLGVHTEMYTDGILPLIKCGAIDNSRKKFHMGKTISCFVMGSKALYEFVNDNAAAIQLESGYVNSVTNIARNPKVIAINSAVEIDLTGQVCADSVGSNIISGVGGQMDFIRGATLSPGGKAIIAITSRTFKGVPRIVPTLRAGAGVVTTRAHVHYVATEYGIADLYGKTLSERAKALIQIAHPMDREELDKAWHGLRRK